MTVLRKDGHWDDSVRVGVLELWEPGKVGVKSRGPAGTFAGRRLLKKP